MKHSETRIAGPKPQLFVKVLKRACWPIDAAGAFARCDAVAGIFAGELFRGDASGGRAKGFHLELGFLNWPPPPPLTGVSVWHTKLVLFPPPFFLRSIFPGMGQKIWMTPLEKLGGKKFHANPGIRLNHFSCYCFRVVTRPETLRFLQWKMSAAKKDVFTVENFAVMIKYAWWAITIWNEKFRVSLLL